jgi:FKBP-type peptidyl-prolyl cis-trans isomerase
MKFLPMTRLLPILALLLMSLPAFGWAQGTPAFPDLQSDKFVTTPSGLKVWVMEEGTGAKATSGKTAYTRYAGWLENGVIFDSNTDGKATFKFKVGKKEVIPAWDEAVQLLGAGGKAYLIVPSALGYGDNGIEDLIPQKATLIFYMEVVKVK